MPQFLEMIANNRSIMFTTRKIWKFYNQNFVEMHKDKSPCTVVGTWGTVVLWHLATLTRTRPVIVDAHDSHDTLLDGVRVLR